MGYRITIVLSIAVLAALAAFQFGRSGGDDPAAEKDKGTGEFFGELGIIGALTATARAGGALDPTALVTPTTAPSSTTGAGIQPTNTPVEPTAADLPPQLRVSKDKVAPGEDFTLQVDGAEPGELFDVSLNGGEPIGTAVADENGSATIKLTVPEDQPPGEADVTFSGAESPSTSVPITVAVEAPEASVDPSEAASGDSVTVEGRGFKPSEAVMVSIDGKALGSAVAGADGSLSITTRLPELAEGEHEVELEGSEGSQAAADISIRPELAGVGGPAGLELTPSPLPAPSPTVQPAEATAAPQATATVAATEISTAQPQAAAASGTGEPPSSDAPGGLDQLEPWLYAVLGAFAAWMAALTLWVYRMDRRKEITGESLADAIADAFAVRRQAQADKKRAEHQKSDIGDAA